MKKKNMISKCVLLKFLIAICMLSIVITGCKSVSQKTKQLAIPEIDKIDSEQVSSEKEIVKSPDINRIMDMIRSVSAYKRAMGSQGEKDACAYLKKTIEAYGYSTDIQVFPFDLQRKFRIDAEDNVFWDVDIMEKEKDGESQNLIAVKESNISNNKKAIVLSAHYDDTGYGAVIDNATGVSILMEVARLVADLKLTTEIRFVLFGGEENGLIGSRYYVSKLSKDEKKSIIANINLDYIGEESSNNIIIATIGGEENEASDLFKNFLEKREIEIVDAQGGDYISFARAGIPSVSLGQLPVPWKLNYDYESEEEYEKSLIEFEVSRLDESRLKVATDMILKVLTENVK